MTGLKPCCFANSLSKYCYCHIEIIRTAAPPPKNIRIGCEFHGVWLPECFETVGEAVNAWNMRFNGYPEEPEPPDVFKNKSLWAITHGYD